MTTWAGFQSTSPVAQSAPSVALKRKDQVPGLRVVLRDSHLPTSHGFPPGSGMRSRSSGELVPFCKMTFGASDASPSASTYITRKVISSSSVASRGLADPPDRTGGTLGVPSPHLSEAVMLPQVLGSNRSIAEGHVPSGLAWYSTRPSPKVLAWPAVMSSLEYEIRSSRMGRKPTSAAQPTGMLEVWPHMVPVP